MKRRESCGDVTELKLVSRKLCEVMADIGVTEEVVQLRIKVGVEREKVTNVCYKLSGLSKQSYNMGSQSEGK